MLESVSRWKYLQLLSGVYLAMFLIRVAFGIVIITFGQYVTANDFVLGLLNAAVPLFEFVTVIFAGLIVDRYGRKGVLLAGLALGAISLYALALAEPHQLFLIGFAQALHGVAAGFILVTTLAIIASYAPPEKRGREMGLFNFANIFGLMAGSAIGSVLLDALDSRGLDLRFTFVLAGFLATLGLLYGYMNIREPKRSAEVEHLDLGQLARVFANGRVQVLAAAWLVVFMFVGGLLAFFSREVLGTSAVEAAEEVTHGGATGTSVGLGILGMGIAFMGSQLLFGKLADKYGREKMMLLGAVGFVGFALVAVFGLQFDPSFAVRSPLFTPLLVLTPILTLAFAPAGLAALADEATERTEGTTMSAYSIVLNAGMFVGPILLGTLKELGQGPGVYAFLIGEATLLLGLVLLRIYQVRGDTRAPHPVAVPAATEAGSRLE